MRQRIPLLQLVALGGLTFVALSCLGGQSGDNVGGRQCGDDATCERLASFWVDAINRPKTNPPVFDLGRCIRADVFDGSIAFGPNHDSDVVCECAAAERGSLYLHATNRCLVRSRGRTCLYAGEELPGCDPDAGSADPCSTVCNDLTARIAQDAQRDVGAFARSATCDQNRGDCAIVIEIEDRCYVNASEEEHDCSLSDEEIVAEEIRRRGHVRTGTLSPGY